MAWRWATRASTTCSSKRPEGETPERTSSRERASALSHESLSQRTARSVFCSSIKREDEPMRVFITGATGVIGSRAVPLLLQAGHTVTAASRSEHNREALRRAGAAPVNVDLFDVNSVRRVIAGHDAVINLATHIPSSAVKIMIRWAWRTNDRIRREASAAIATAAIEEGVGRTIQESFA